MVKFNALLTGRDPKSQKPFPGESVKKQKLAAAMAWQILNIYPYRSKPFEWLKYRDLRGVMLADEVGGGKTFEALAIVCKDYLENVKSSKKQFRVLVISAPAIRSKWEWCPAKSSLCQDKGCDNCKHSIPYDLNKFVRQSQVQKKKGQLKRLIVPANYEQYRSQIVGSKLNWKVVAANMKRQGLWLCSVNSLPPTKGKKSEAYFKKSYGFPDGAFDWIVADEAHIFRSGYMVSDENLPVLSETAIRKLYAVLNANPHARLLLLTATPFQNNINELIQLLSLLENNSDKGTVANIAIGGLRAFENKLREMELKSSFITDEDIRNLHAGLHHDISKLLEAINEDINLKRPKEIRKKRQRDGLDDYLRDLIVRNRKEPLKSINIMATLTEADRLQYLLLRDLVYESEKKGRSMISQKLSALVSSPGAFCKGKKNSYDIIDNYFDGNQIYYKKRDALLNVIDSMKLTSKKVVVVFCRFIPTLRILAEDIQKLRRSFKVLTLHAKRPDGVDVKNRKPLLDRIRAMNRASKKRIVFLVSQVGNEGLDFDDFCNTVIHFDGHYNPAVIDQRNGRVYRGNNQHRDISVIHLLLNETYDQRIKFIEQEKRKLKNFYLGDADLDQILEKILGENQKIKSEYLGKLKGFKIDLEPRVGHLINELHKEL